MTGDSVLPNGQEVKRLRRSRGWTQDDMARRIQDRAGPFSKRTLQSIEAGRPVHLRSIRLVAEELAIDVTELLHDHRATPNNLPSRLTSFIGREKERVEIGGLLSENRLVTLTGTGGCGKSRLALEIAADRISDYPDGVWLVELEALANPALLAQTVAIALNVREEPKRPLIEILVRHLKYKRSLLLLDNCEHLLSACAELASNLLQSCTELRILATSREGMNITGEAICLVPSLQLPAAKRHSRLDELQEVESVRLFVERAAAVRSGFSLAESNAAAVVKICERLDGIPFALELAAARMRTISADDIAERLDDRFHLLTDGYRATLSKHRTLRAMIDWSYDLLSDDERTLLRRLSMFAGGWTLEAAEAVCADERIETGKVLDLLSHLVGKSLVEVESGDEQGTSRIRYRLLGTVRQYALERLIEREEDGAACERHRGFFLALAEEAEPKLDGPDQRAWLARLQDEHDNLRAALRACRAGNHGNGEVGLRLAGALGLFWEVCGFWSEGRAMCAELLAGADAGARSLIRAKAMRTAGKLALLLGDTAEARSLLEESLGISRELADSHGIASSLNELGILASDQGSFAEARDLYAESLAITRKLGNRCGIANSLMNLGVMARRQGDHAAARSFYEESLAIMRELGDRRRIAMVLANLGNVAHGQSDFAEAHSLYAECLVIFRELGDKPGVANTLNNLGNVASRQQDLAAARSLYEEGLTIARELGDKRGTGRFLGNLGNVAFKEGDFAEARALYEESVAIARDLGDKQGTAALLHDLAIIARLQGRHVQSRSLSEESLVIHRELGDKRGVAESLGHLGLVAWSEGNYAQARSLCAQSLAIGRELADIAGIAECLVTLGCVASYEGHARRAIRLFASGQVVAERDYGLDPSTLDLLESSLSALRSRVDNETFAREWSAGQAMGLDQAIQYALGE